MNLLFLSTRLLRYQLMLEQTHGIKNACRLHYILYFKNEAPAIIENIQLSKLELNGFVFEKQRSCNSYVIFTEINNRKNFNIGCYFFSAKRKVRETTKSNIFI